MKQPKVICITGGIGSGKSTVCAMLEDKGQHVYYSDERAKALMQSDPTLIDGIIALLGERAYSMRVLNRSYIAEKIFGNMELKHKLEALVHPAVHKDFDQWKMVKDSALVFKESALVFEIGDSNCTHIVSVVADEDQRVSRVLARNPELKESQIRERLSNQLDDAYRRAKSDTLLENNGTLEELEIQLNYLLSKVI
ncbi:MAG TPA: dephospho-CoA kinase [Cryomorphaceae bacterium]|nr:dephospho-CoA kinase [Cryomorphaceae bacterium]